MFLFINNCWTRCAFSFVHMYHDDTAALPLPQVISSLQGDRAKIEG